MDINYIYYRVETFVKEHYGTKRWCYTDYFIDDKGKNYFIEQLETDKDIMPDWDDEEIIEHICDSLKNSMGVYEIQQAMLNPRISKYDAKEH